VHLKSLIRNHSLVEGSDKRSISAVIQPVIHRVGDWKWRCASIDSRSRPRSEDWIHMQMCIHDDASKTALESTDCW
jgi:hypothetical protein